MGEIGRPLHEIVRGVYPLTEAYDIKWGEVELPRNIDVLHVCYPYSENFVAETVNYALKTRPKLLLIESTVMPGTTSTIARINTDALHLGAKGNYYRGNNVAHSPVNGRVADGFKWCFYNYTKFIGPVSREAGEMAEDYYKSLGFKTRVFKSPSETEFAKLVDLAYFAVMLGWNQEMRRIADMHTLDFDEIAEFLNDVTVKSGYRFPRPVYDGKPIGGHCIIPATKLLYSLFNSKFLEVIWESNKRRENGH
jgi:UDP-N-acetyl-D-mannosaminuronate dehydrogenase